MKPSQIVLEMLEQDRRLAEIDESWIWPGMKPRDPYTWLCMLCRYHLKNDDKYSYTQWYQYMSAKEPYMPRKYYYQLSPNEMDTLMPKQPKLNTI